MKARILCLSPLSHGSFGADEGNAVSLRREPIVSLPGAPLVPVVSGNAIRGKLRRLLARELFTAANLGPADAERWDDLYAAIANGGTLRDSETRLQPERIREVRAALPMLSLFGSFLYRWTLAGHFDVRGFVWPVCTETVSGGIVDVPEDYAGEIRPVNELVSETSVTRLPDTDNQNPEVTSVKPMPVTLECFSTGTELRVQFGFAAHAPAIERSCLAHGLTLLTSLGGKAAQGFGAIEVRVVGGDPEPYRGWLADSGEAARAALLALPSTWT